MGRTMSSIVVIAAWVTGSCISAELLGYWLHRLMHSGLIAFLSRNHMKHHLTLYGPLHRQRTDKYRDATNGRASLGNIGIEWLLPGGLFILGTLAVFRLLHVQVIYQLTYFATTVGWSFLMFSYLHDAMHVEGFWLAKNRVLKQWRVSARRRHDLHHQIIDDQGLMNRNFGIGFFLFDRAFGTFSDAAAVFNLRGYRAAKERFKSVLNE